MVRILAFLLLTISAAAQAADWRYAGTNMHEKEHVTTFVDISDMKRLQNGTARVWIKTITLSSLLLQHRNGSFIDRTKNKIANKIAGGYVPPFFLLPSVQGFFENDALLQRAIVEAAVDEYLANDGDMPLTMVSKMLLEINCDSKKTAVLSVTRYDRDDNSQTSEDAESPNHVRIFPHYQMEWISQMVCH
jgi:hypothetical protein